MLSLCVKAENTKLHRSVIWLACFILPIIPSIMGTYNYIMNRDILTGDWYSLWTQFSLFYALFFYAPLIGLYASYMWRLEHLNHNWNVLMTMPVPASHIFGAKLLIITKVTIITQIWLVFQFFLSGKFVIGFQSAMPIEIVWWALRGIFAAMAIGALQLLLSMCIRSFAVPIGIALAGGVAGMLAVNMEKSIYFPYSLMLMGMNANSYEDKLQSQIVSYLVSCLIFFLVFTGISICVLKHKDVKAG